LVVSKSIKACKPQALCNVYISITPVLEAKSTTLQ